MPVERFIHPRASRSKRVALLTDLEFRVWVQCLLSADDFGVMRASAVDLQSANDALHGRKAKVLTSALEQLLRAPLVLAFEHQGVRFLCQPKWQSFQKVEYPRHTDMPKPPEETLALCDEATRALFAKYPGGQRKDRRRSEGIPNESQESAEGIPSTRAHGYAKRLTLTAHGVRQTAEANGERPPAPPMDVWFQQLVSAYPPQSVTSSHLTQASFMQTLLAEPDAALAFAEMLENLENQKRGHQWRVKRMIPRLDRWIHDGLWKQRHEETPPSMLMSDKTARTLASAAEFVKDGER